MVDAMETDPFESAAGFAGLGLRAELLGEDEEAGEAVLMDGAAHQLRQLGQRQRAVAPGDGALERHGHPEELISLGVLAGPGLEEAREEGRLLGIGGLGQLFHHGLGGHFLGQGPLSALPAGSR